MNFRLTTIILASAFVVVASLVTLVRYEFTPGQHAHAPRSLTSELASEVGTKADGFVMLVFVHPRCPCTAATMSELERLAARLNPSVASTVCVYLAGGVPESWAQTDYWERARQISSCRVICDRHGELAAAFGVATSGHVLLYHDSNLLYSGGITSSRGHEGGNEGIEAIVKMVQEHDRTFTERPVFGCVIRSQP
ncbi:MAG: hypothetical protein AAF497_07105 [Planctomycetota bacterium]